MIALSLALIIVLGVGVGERGAFGAPRDVLTGREFLAMFMRGGAASPHRVATSQRFRYHLSDNELVDRRPHAFVETAAVGMTTTTTSTASPTTTTTVEPSTTTVDFLDSPDTTDPSMLLIETTSLSPESEPPQASQVVAVSVSSSVVRQKPATLYVETQDEPSFSSAVQSQFSVDEGPLTLQRKDSSQTSVLDGNIGASSHYTVERSQDGEKTSLVVRQNNGEASSHFSIRQSHSPPRLVHRLTTTTTGPTMTTEEAVSAVVEEVSRLSGPLDERKTAGLKESLAQVEQGELEQYNLNKGNDKRTEEDIDNERKGEGRREERTSFSVERNQKSYEPTYRLERKEERTSYSVGAQIARQPKHASVNWEEPEVNYEVDEAVSVVTNGRAHGVQPQAKSGYVVEGRNFRKYRVEEKTPDGFIVGEYGVVSHDDGSLRGVRYTADSNINPRLIYDALVKFLSLK